MHELTGEDMRDFLCHIHQGTKQDFLQVFRGSGMEKMEGNKTSVDPLSIQLIDHIITNGGNIDRQNRYKESLLWI